MDNPILVNMFCSSFEQIQSMVHENAVMHGWWEDVGTSPTPADQLAKISLMVTELSEAIEAIREQKEKSDKIEFKAVEEELADVIIRIMDFAGYMGLDIAGALLAKHKYNIKRPYKHGKVI